MAGGGGGGLTSMLPMALAIGATIATDGAAAPLVAELGSTGGAMATAGLIGAGSTAVGGIMQGQSGSDILKNSIVSGLTGAGTAGLLSGINGVPATTPDATQVAGVTTTSPGGPSFGPYTGASAVPVPSEAMPYGGSLGSDYTSGANNFSGPESNQINPNSFFDKTYVPKGMALYAPAIAAQMAGGSMFAQPTLSGIQPPASTSSLPNYTGALGVTPQAYRGAFNAPTALGYPTYPARQVGSPTSNPRGYADGGPIDSTGGGANTIEEMSRQNATGSNQMYPQANLSGLTGTNTYQNATNTPISNNMISSPTDTPTDPYTGAMRFAGGGDIGAIDQEKVDELVANAKTVEGSKELAMGVKANDINALQAVQLLGQLNKIPQVQKVTNPALAGKVANPMASQVSQAGLPVQAAKGGIMNGVGTIGSYSDGGQMLKGPGDGMSDSIPAKIGKHQPARLADSEFVVPADVVSHLGNGSSDAGAKQLYAMMDRVRKARTGNKKQGKEIKPQKYMPA